MKRLIITLLSVICLPCFGQTVINREGEIKAEPFVTPYDSLSNFRKFQHDDCEDYYHLIGQTALYIGNPYANSNNPDLVVGDEYIIQDVVPDGFWKKAVCNLVVKNLKNNKVTRINPGLMDRMNLSWIVNGYVEKLYSVYAGQDYLYYGSHQYSHNKADYLINCETNTINKHIPDGTKWTFLEIQILPRLKNDGMELDHRCGVVFVLDNSEYGKYYIYYENSDGDGANGPFVSMFKKITYHQADDLSYIKIGMSEDDCRAILGNPIRVRTTVSITNGKVEKTTVLEYYDLSITIKNDEVVEIDNSCLSNTEAL